MPGRNPWVLLGVAEDAPYQEVQRSFRRMVKTTHPDGGGDARAFDALVRAFEDIRSTPYDGWLRPSPPVRSWSDEGPGYGGAAEPTNREAAVPMRSGESDFTAVLLDEMTKVRDLVTV
jgi:hypothetical protein